jgi:hypothetical protein
MRQGWLPITTPTKEKLILLEIDEGEHYTTARPRHLKIQNVLKTQWIMQVNLIVNMFCQRRESDLFLWDHIVSHDTAELANWDDCELFCYTLRVLKQNTKQYGKF